MNDEIPTHCIQGQESNALCGTEEDGVRNLSIRTFIKLLESQKTHTYCQNIVRLESCDNRCTVNENGLICQLTFMNVSIQAIVVKVFCLEFLFNKHYPIFTALPGTRRMYDELRHVFCWSHMSADVYVLAVQSTSCCRH